MRFPKLGQAQLRLARGTVAATIVFFLYLYLVWAFLLLGNVPFPSATAAFASLFLPPAIIGGYITKDIVVGACAGAIGNLLPIIIYFVIGWLPPEGVLMVIVGLFCGFAGGAFGGFLRTLISKILFKQRKDKTIERDA